MTHSQFVEHVRVMVRQICYNKRTFKDVFNYFGM